MIAEREKYLKFIQDIITDHPDWLADVQYALQRGLEACIEKEKELRARAETALVLLAGDLKRVKPHQREIVAKAIVGSDCFKGSEFANQIESKYLKPKAQAK